MQDQLTHTQIVRRIDELSAAANARMLESSPEFSSAMGGAGIDFMSAEERRELHSLQLQLPTFAELRQEAKDRIAARIAARKGKRGLQPSHEHHHCE